jgi:hypothetical protein
MQSLSGYRSKVRSLPWLPCLIFSVTAWAVFATPASASPRVNRPRMSVSGIDRGNGSYHPKQAGLAAEALVRLHWKLSSPVSCRTGIETLHTRGFSCSDAYRRAQRALRVWERLSFRANRPVTTFTSGGVRWRQNYTRLPGCCEAQILKLHGFQGTRLIDYELFQSQ